MTESSNLTRSLKRMKRQAPNEERAYYQMLNKAIRASRRAAPSVGTISEKERRAIRRAGKATEMVTTAGERKGTKQKLRRKARQS